MIGGDIVVKETALGKGTVIELAFPLNEAQTATDEQDAEKKPAAKKALFRVLWVEDDGLIRLSARQMVRSLGHTCDVAESGKKALELLDKNTYDLVITDIGMPDMSGWQLTAKIREKSADKIKVAVVSGWKIEENEKTEHGVEWVLEKPFDIAALENLFLELKDDLKFQDSNSKIQVPNRSEAEIPIFHRDYKIQIKIQIPNPDSYRIGVKLTNSFSSGKSCRDDSLVENIEMPKLKCCKHDSLFIGVGIIWFNTYSVLYCRPYRTS